MRKYQDLSGLRVGRLHVSSDSVIDMSNDFLGPDSPRRRRFWWCDCACGASTMVYAGDLKRGKTRSCGCLKREARHGVRTPTRRAWDNMRDRCGKPGTPYEHVHVCERWASFDAFVEDMGVRPTGMSLDRVDPAGHYEPGNVRWATAATQANNKTNARWIKFDGKVLTASQWSRRVGLPRKTITDRLDRGLPVEQAFAAKGVEE